VTTARKTKAPPPPNSPITETIPLDIDEIKPHPRNARQGDVGQISESLRIHGQYRPIVVNKTTMEILAGNHTWQAARALGWKTIAATLVEVDEDEALRILLVDNRLNDQASYDDSALVSVLSELAISAAGLVGTGFDADDLDDLIAQLEPPETVEEGPVLGGAAYAIVIDCVDEHQQLELLERFGEEGFAVRPLMM
jgi:ParB-like chromosome segregation protein Spo0J